ncbi:MAG: hypothetical protein IJW51_07745 [Clostridia bacterium]|nr:hypothetical protein [Clostridia bacterium]
MKHKSAWIRVLLLTLCLVLVLSSLAGCVSEDEFASLKQQLEETQSKVNQTTTKLEEVVNSAETKATVAELRALVDQIKATADSAVTAAQLAEIATKLDAVKATADAAVTAQTLAEAKTALEALITANGTQDATVKAALEAAQTKIATLEAAVAAQAALADKVAAIEAALANNADKAYVDAAVNALKAQVSTDLTAVTARVAALEAALENNADKAYVDAAIAGVNEAIAALATKAELDDAVEACKTYAAELDAAIDAKIVALQGQFTDLAAKAEGNAAAIIALQTELATINQKLADLEANKSAFADAYKEATLTLKGESEEYGDTYSLATFEATVKVYIDGQPKYDAAAYATFVEKVDRIRFYLTRATSVEEIIALFGDLDAAKANLEANDLTKSFPELLESLVGKVTYDTDLTTVVNTFALLPVEDQAANQAEYDAILAAKDYLVAAKAEADALAELIAAQGMIVYGVSETAVAGYRATLDAIQATYFTAVSADTMVYKYYFTTVVEEVATVISAADLLSNYADLVTMEKRVEELAAAFDAIATTAEIIDIIKNYNTARPLFNQMGDIDANVAQIDAWIEAYSLETENVEALYAAYYSDDTVYPLVALADAYATAMDALYQAYVVEAKEAYGNQNMVSAVAALKAKVDANTYTIGNDWQLHKAVRNALDALQADIALVAEFDPLLDNNYAEMVKDFIADFAPDADPATLTVCDRNDQLVLLRTELNNLNEVMKALLPVEYDDAQAIQDYRGFLDAKYEAYNIVKGDENYVELATEVEATLASLEAAYAELVADILNIYNEAMDLLNSFKDGEGNIVINLALGNNLIEVVDKLAEIVIDKGLTEVQLRLDDAGTTDLEQLYNDFVAITVKFDEKAQAAQTDAATVNALIEALATLNADKLNNYDQIVAAYDALVAWYKLYIDADFDETAEGAQAAMIAAIDLVQEIEIFDTTDTVDLYSFVVTANAQAVVDAYNTAVATYAAAEVAAADLLAQMNALITTWNVHSDFASVQALYDTFVATYYDDATFVDACDFFAVLPVYGAIGTVGTYADTQKAYTDACTAAQNMADNINSLIAALPTDAIEMDAADALLLEIQAIYDLIADFYANGSHCTDPCDACIETYFTVAGKNNIVELYRVKTSATIASEYKAVYDTAAAEVQSEMRVYLNLYNNMLYRESVQTIDACDTVYRTAAKQLDTYRTTAP